MRRNLFPVMLLFLLSSLLWACFDESEIITEQGTDDPKEISLTIQTDIFSGIGANRAYTDTEHHTKFEEGDRIGIFAVPRTNPSVQALPDRSSCLILNIPFTYTGGKWISDGNTPHYYPTSGAVLDIYAYYPYDAYFTLTSQTYYWNQTVKTGEFLVGRALNVVKSSSPVSVVLKHKFSLTEFFIPESDEFAHFDLTLLDIGTMASFSFGIHEASELTQLNSTSYYKDVKAEKYSDDIFRAYLIPQDLYSAAQIVRLDINSEIYDFSLGINRLDGGVAYNFNTTVISMDDGLSNCYMMSPGSYKTFPVTRAFNVWLENSYLYNQGKDLSEAATAEIVWQEKPGIVSSPTLHYTAGNNAEMRVSAGNTAGNAVIGIRVNGDIIWTWHIWVTNYNPESPSSQSTINGITFMDRNLGSPDGNSPGLFYQWGRKDPFPGPEVSSAPVITGKPVSEQIADNMLTAFTEPLTFITDPARRGDWYSIRANKGKFHWNERDGAKSRMDPCPAGWRVPPANEIFPWQGLSTGNGVREENGWRWTDAGFYPFTGKREETTGAISQSSEYGGYWSATPSTSGNSYTAVALELSGTSVKQEHIARSKGLQVRCVKEN